VLGHREAEIRPVLAGTGVQFAINRDYRQGMLSSIKTGLAMLGPNSDAFLLALVDQPMIGRPLDRYADRGIREGRQGDCRADLRGTLGPPGASSVRLHRCD
jgi:molybdenum cofactor cytidylyltransferase